MRIETRRSGRCLEKTKKASTAVARRPLSSRRERQLRSRDCRLETRTIYSFAPLRRSPESVKTPYAFHPGKYRNFPLRAANGCAWKRGPRASVVLNRTPAKTNFSLGVIISWKYLFRNPVPPPFLSLCVLTCILCASLFDPDVRGLFADVEEKKISPECPVGVALKLYCTRDASDGTISSDYLAVVCKKVTRPDPNNRF